MLNMEKKTPNLKVDIWELQRLLDGNWFLCEDRVICSHKHPRTIKKPWLRVHFWTVEKR